MSRSTLPTTTTSVPALVPVAPSAGVTLAPADRRPPGHHSAPSSERGHRLRRLVEGTPGRLRVVAGLTVFACTAFAVLGALAIQARADALSDARAAAAQLVRVQDIGISLVRADAAATNAFLSAAGGLPPAQAVKDYDAAISTASRRIADAARAEPGDARALALVNDDLTDYTARVAAAQQASRNAASPTLATGYLGLASQTLLRDSMLPRLDDAVDANSARVDAAFSASERARRLLLASGIAVVLVLVGVSAWLALRTRRVLNLPLIAATALVVVTLVATALLAGSVQSSADRVRSTNFVATQALAEARIAAYRAKADESISLIRQNFRLEESGGQVRYVDPAQAPLTDARRRLSEAGAGSAGPALEAWTAVHDEIVARVTRGDIPGARQLATNESNITFADVEKVTANDLGQQARQVADGFGERRALLLVLAGVAFVLGLLAAAAAYAGIAQRLEEYR